MNHHHYKALEHFFLQGPKPTAAHRDSMAGVLGIHKDEVSAWFQERRAREKVTKKREQMETLKALENAHRPDLPIDAPGRRTIEVFDCRPQYNASAAYSSLNRSLVAAAACIPTVNTNQQTMYSDSIDQFAYEFPIPSPTSNVFDQMGMYRTDSAYSGTTTPGESDTTDYAWPQTMTYSNHPYGHTTQQIDIAQPQRTSRRPQFSRTRTCPEVFSRPVPRRTVSSSLLERQESAEPVRIKRRPKLSPLGIGMSRSQSSLGYENSEYPYPCAPRLINNENAQPMTPIKRIPSATTFPRVARSFTAPSPVGMRFQDSHFPPSPISPKDCETYTQTKTDSLIYNVSSMIAEDDITPPDTPLTTLSLSQENVLTGASPVSFYDEIYGLGQADFSQANLSQYDLTLEDIFPCPAHDMNQL